MEIRHKVTKQNQTVTPEEWDVLKTEGFAKNFDVISTSEFSPPELAIPAMSASAQTETPPAQEKKEKAKA
ncbi:hypothetical protein [Spirosoma litoris]